MSVFTKSPPMPSTANTIESYSENSPAEIGPWDSSLLEHERQKGSYQAKHRINDAVRMSMTSCDFDIDVQFLDSVFLDTPVDGEFSDSIHMVRKTRVDEDSTLDETISLRILASPSRIDSRWESHLVESFTSDLASKSDGEVVTSLGFFGTEIDLQANGGSAESYLKVIGSSGPRWTAILTLYTSLTVVTASGDTQSSSVAIADDVVEEALQMLSSMVVWRSHEPYPPDTPLPMQILR